MILLYDFIIFSDLPTHIENLGNVFVSVECRNPTLASVGVKPNTWKKLGLESSGTPECSELDSKAQNTSH